MIKTRYKIKAKGWLADDWQRHFGVTEVAVDVAPTEGIAPHPRTGDMVKSWGFPFRSLQFGDQRRFVRHWATRMLVTERLVERIMKDRTVYVPIEDCELEVVTC